eukprot:g1004.t1
MMKRSRQSLPSATADAASSSGPTKRRRKRARSARHVSIRGIADACVLKTPPSTIAGSTTQDERGRAESTPSEDLYYAIDNELTDAKFYEIRRELDEKGARFTEYYKETQGILGQNGDWDKFFKFLHQPLCVSFRFSSLTSKKADVVQAMLQGAGTTGGKDEWPSEDRSSSFRSIRDHFLHPTVLYETGRQIPKPFKYRFGAHTVAFQMCYDAKTMARHFPQVQRWLVDNHRRGVLERQEIVSMFPVFFLQVEKTHRVLDLCASPGSKTSQALERLVDFSGVSSTSVDVGFLIANELDPRRAGTLAKRISFGAKYAAVTNHRAQVFPEIMVKSNHDPRDPNAEPPKAKPLRFDRIICDVPCSGDGTMRKYEEKWRTWDFALGRQLHSLQLQILVRGLRLLEVGGLLCYSTCSLNPLENEAVVAAALQRLGNENVELLDLHSGEGVGITEGGIGTNAPCKMAKGITKWSVVAERKHVAVAFDEEAGGARSSRQNCDEVEGRHYVVLPSYEASQKMLTKQEKKKYRKSMWAEGPAANEMKKTARLMPHYANTGGFFCCVFRKKKEWACATGTGPGAFSRRKLRPTFAEEGQTASEGGEQVFEKVGCKTETVFRVTPRLHEILSKPHPFKIVFAGEKVVKQKKK